LEWFVEKGPNRNVEHPDDMLDDDGRRYTVKDIKNGDIVYVGGVKMKYMGNSRVTFATTSSDDDLMEWSDDYLRKYLAKTCIIKIKAVKR